MYTNASETNITVRDPDKTVIIIVDFIFICTSAIGAFANILIIYVICRTKSLRTSMNANLVSLSVADLIVCIFLIPIRLILYNIDNTRIGGIDTLCRIDVFLKSMCDSAQLFMLVSTSFERYQSIARPFEKQGHGKRTGVSLTAAWLLSLGLGIFISQYCGDGGTIYPCYDQNHQIFYGHWGDKEKNITLPLGLMCLFLVVVFYGRIMKLLNEHNTSMQKRFKTKVSPAEKITEKSTSNVLKINSTVHVPIPKPEAAKTVQPTGEEHHKPNQMCHNRLQNGTLNIQKNAIVEDSGYNEPEHTARNSDPRLENDNDKIMLDDSKGPKPDHSIRQQDGNDRTQQEYVKYFNVIPKQQKNIHTFPEGDDKVEGKSPLASWRKIIKGRMFNTHTEKEPIERSPDSIKVLNVRETKRFPLIRERVTLAKLETSRAEKLKQKNNAQPSFTQRNRGTMPKAKSASDIYQNSFPKRNKTFFKPTYNSLSTLRGKDKPYSDNSKAGDNQVHPNETLKVYQNATSSSSKDCDTFDAGKPHLTVLRRVSRVIMALMPIRDSDSLSNKIVAEENETQGPSIDRTEGVITFTTAREHVDNIKLRQNLKTNTLNNDNNKINVTIPFNLKSNSNDIKENADVAQQIIKENGDVAQQNTTHEESKGNEVVNLKAKIKKDSLKRVEVVEMDGTVHKKVKVESGAVVGAVCVMNNSNRVQGRRKVEMRTAKNIAILIGTFILLWLPLPVVVIIISSSFDISNVSVEPVLIIASASSLTVALNPILNVLLNKQMRSRTITTLKNCKSKIR